MSTLRETQSRILALPRLVREYGSLLKLALAGEFLVHAANLVFHGLVLVDAGPELHGRRDPRHAGAVERLVAPLDGRENGVPLTFNIGSVGVQLCLEAGFSQDPFT